MFIFLNSFLT